MNNLDIQQVSSSLNLPTIKQLQFWVNAALKDYEKDTEILIRIVDEDESAQLNQQYRHKNGATNILSFPFEAPEHISTNLLGDLVVCAPVIERQAAQQQKILFDHWAHIIIHGVLHLLGYDHLEEKDAFEMENKEIHILASINIKNPYQEIENE